MYAISKRKISNKTVWTTQLRTLTYGIYTVMNLQCSFKNNKNIRIAYLTTLLSRRAMIKMMKNNAVDSDLWIIYIIYISLIENSMTI